MKMVFKLGEAVYLKTDTEQLRRIVTEAAFSGSSMANSMIIYELSQGVYTSKHYEVEITRERDETISLGM